MKYRVTVELTEVGDGGKVRLVASHLMVELDDEAKAERVYRGTMRLIEEWALAKARLLG